MDKTVNGSTESLGRLAIPRFSVYICRGNTVVKRLMGQRNSLVDKGFDDLQHSIVEGYSSK
jgi:hypothetical protein